VLSFLSHQRGGRGSIKEASREPVSTSEKNSSSTRKYRPAGAGGRRRSPQKGRAWTPISCRKSRGNVLGAGEHFRVDGSDAGPWGTYRSIGRVGGDFKKGHVDGEVPPTIKRGGIDNFCFKSKNPKEPPQTNTNQTHPNPQRRGGRYCKPKKSCGYRRFTAASKLPLRK